MRLHAELIGDHHLLRDNNGQPQLVANPFTHYRGWARDGSAPKYLARINSPHPRTIVCPSDTQAAFILAPNAPLAEKYRLILGNGNYTPTGNLGAYSSRLGELTINASGPIPIPSNAYTTVEFDPATLFGNQYYEPSLYQIRLGADISENYHELGDIRLYASINLDPLLADLVPLETTYETSLFAPLTHRDALMGRTLRTRAAALTLLIARSDPALEMLQRLHDFPKLHLELNDIYLPVALESLEIAPTGGALFSARLRLLARNAHAFSHERYLKTIPYSGQVLDYNLPGDAPAPVEIRIQINNTPPSTPIVVHLPAAGEILAFQPDAAGIWSLHDTGRIYHAPQQDPTPLNDRTDTLLSGALPIILPPGNGHILLEHNTNYTISHVTLAAYPRYHPEHLL